MAKKTKPQKLVLTHNRAPGDVVVMTGLVRDLMLAHPGRFQIDVQTSAMDIWRHNPYITNLRKKKGPKPDVRYVQTDYGRGIRDQNYEPVHFLAYFHRDFERQLNVKVPLMKPYPDLHLSREEKAKPIVEGRYWVMISGGKSDFTAKVWECRRMQAVAEQLGKMGLGAVQVGSTDSGHWHPPLEGDNVINLVGRTNLRDLMRLIYHSDGVICGITCAMHMAAALHRPCVVVAGGREAWWWEAYVRENRGLAPVADQLEMPHKFLHTIGLLDCCKHHGCWKNKVVPLKNDKSLCYKPVMKPVQPIPLCMDLITVDHVMEAVMQYYTDRSLPPIGSPPAQELEQHTPSQVEIPDKKPPEPAATKEEPPARPPRSGLLSLFDVPAAEDAHAEEVARIDAQVAEAARKSKEQPNGKSTKARASTRLSLPKDHPLAQAAFSGKSRVNGNAIKVNNSALEGRPNSDPNQPVHVAHKPGSPHPAVVSTDPAMFDHDDIGGRFTACMLFYGPQQYHDLHRRCLESFLSTTPRDRIDLRVGSNALNPQSLALIQKYVDEGVITKHYEHKENVYKYPVMREMFWDESHPITTKWILWFDDDSICDRTPAWLNVLGQHIIQHHRRDNAHMFGAPFIWTLQNGQKQWYERRPWHRGKPWRLHNGQPSPNGNKIIFPTGGFWALSREAMIACNIPDPEIGHNGGDVTIGEQLYQGGYRMKSWNAKKQFIHTSSVKRRGETKPMPGTAGHADFVPRLVQV